MQSPNDSWSPYTNYQRDFDLAIADALRKLDEHMSQAIWTALSSIPGQRVVAIEPTREEKRAHWESKQGERKEYMKAVSGYKDPPTNAPSPGALTPVTTEWWMDPDVGIPYFEKWPHPYDIQGRALIPAKPDDPQRLNYERVYGSIANEERAVKHKMKQTWEKSIERYETLERWRTVVTAAITLCDNVLRIQYRHGPPGPYCMDVIAQAKREIGLPPDVDSVMVEWTV